MVKLTNESRDFMRLSKSFFYTIREDLKDEDSTSSNLLLRAGFIKRSSAGVFMMLPLGYKTLVNIENIIREEMNAIDSLEMAMPALVPMEIFEKSNRDQIIGDSMYKLQDRFSRPFALAPTHEELFAIAGKSAVRSYKHLPFSLYQFQTKFRDETRARYGLIRVREFIMKDAYSFDTNDETCDDSYQNMGKAYNNIFDRLHLDYRVVKADSGIMGGQLSEEYQAIAPIGEDTIVICEACDFASNLEVAPAPTLSYTYEKSGESIEEVHTPNVKTIEDVAQFLNKKTNQLLKTLVYKYNDNEFIAILLNGDHDLNETKLAKYVNAEVEPASEEDIVEYANSVAGFIGPMDLNIKTIADNSVMNMQDFVIGANKKDYHKVNVNLEDITVDEYLDVRNIQESDTCPHCGHKVSFNNAIEVGNIFKLGTGYSEAFDLFYSDQDNKLQPVVMGSYGIGIGRTLAAMVEQHHDEKGLNLPFNIAPYKVSIVVIGTKDEAQMEYADQLYRDLEKQGISTILDDRNERPGVKFNDVDLIGVPIRITVGKLLSEGLVEVKLRNVDASDNVEISELNTYINELITNLSK